MLVQTAYKFELKVRSRQQQKLKRAGGCCRHVWNSMLGLQKGRLDWCEPILVDQEAEQVLAHWKRNGKEFLYNAPSQALQQVIQFQVRALFDAFNPERLQKFPNFKKKNDRRDSFRIPQGMKWSFNHRSESNTKGNGHWMAEDQTMVEANREGSITKSQA